jgi:hypothetical protein
MKTVTEKAVAKNAYGKQLETAIPFEFSYEAFETYPELVSAKEEFTNDEQVSERNIQPLSPLSQLTDRTGVSNV